MAEEEEEDKFGALVVVELVVVVVAAGLKRCAFDGNENLAARLFANGIRCDCRSLMMRKPFTGSGIRLFAPLVSPKFACPAASSKDSFCGFFVEEPGGAIAKLNLLELVDDTDCCCCCCPATLLAASPNDELAPPVDVIEL